MRSGSIFTYSGAFIVSVLLVLFMLLFGQHPTATNAQTPEAAAPAQQSAIEQPGSQSLGEYLNEIAREEPNASIAIRGGWLGAGQGIYISGTITRISDQYVCLYSGLNRCIAFDNIDELEVTP